MIKVVQAIDPKAIAELESDDAAAPDRRSSPATCCKRRAGRRLVDPVRANELLHHRLSEQLVERGLA
jgi:hypothetical protein